MIVITETTIYFYKRKGLLFYFRIIVCKLKNIKYDLLEWEDI